MFLPQLRQPPHALVDDPDLGLDEGGRLVQQVLPDGGIRRSEIGFADLRPPRIDLQGLFDLREREPEERLQFVDPEQLRDIRFGEEAKPAGGPAGEMEEAKLFVVPDGARGELGPLHDLLHPVPGGRVGGCRSCRGFSGHE